LDECRAVGSVAPVAQNHPEVSYDAIWLRFKRQKSGDLNAAIDRHSGSFRIFSHAEEKILADRLRGMRDKGTPLSESIVKAEANKYFDELHGSIQTRQNHREFSHGFMMNFKRRHGFSTQKLAKIQSVKSISADDQSNLAAEFILAVTESIEKFGRHRVFNMAETPTPFVESPQTTWGDKGKKSKYVIKTKKGSKGNITLLPTISASGRKLPLGWVNVGKTRIGIDKMDLPNDIVSFHSPKGWTNESVMIKYLRRVIFKHTKGKECALILDDYGAHWTPKVQNVASELKIQLIRVPKGLTSILQPLDVSFNSSFKQMREIECSNELIRNAGVVEDKEKIVRRAAIAYHKVHKSVVLKGWEPCIINV